MTTRHIRLKLHEGFPIPQSTMDGLNNYLNYGHASGFLTALLSNNLVEAFNRADNNNTDAMRDIAGFMRARLPFTIAWGDAKVVDKFGRMSDMKRQEVRDQMVIAGWAEYE